MITPDGDRAEYTLLCCGRMPKTYLMDLYALYARKENQAESASEHVPPIVTLRVDALSDPSQWLDCIKWSRFRRQGERKCLEVFVSRPTQSQMYYAVGTKGDILIGPNESIKIHASTVNILCGESKTSCPSPKVVWVDRKMNEDPPACEEEPE